MQFGPARECHCGQQSSYLPSESVPSESTPSMSSSALSFSTTSRDCVPPVRPVRYTFTPGSIFAGGCTWNGCISVYEGSNSVSYLGFGYAPERYLYESESRSYDLDLAAPAPPCQACEGPRWEFYSVCQPSAGKNYCRLTMYYHYGPNNNCVGLPLYLVFDTNTLLPTGVEPITVAYNHSLSSTLGCAALDQSITLIPF
jgi:hypothetical protein